MELDMPRHPYTFHRSQLIQEMKSTCFGQENKLFRQGKQVISPRKTSYFANQNKLFFRAKQIE